MKQKNPFRDCATFAEVFQVIREKCEWLRGKPYRVFRTDRGFIYQDVLTFHIETEYTNWETKDGDKHRDLNWLDLLRGSDSPLYKKSLRYGRYDEEPFYDIVGGGSGGSGSRARLGRYTGRISLEHLPVIRKLNRRNHAIEETLKELYCKPYPFTPEDLRAKQYVRDLEQKVEDWKAENKKKYLESHPLHKF